MIKSFELYRLWLHGRQYKINGNNHTLKQITTRGITKEKLQKMVKLSVEKMQVQKTYAVVSGNDKLLILRINKTVYFIITCLVSNMHVKRDTIRLYV